MSTWSGTRAKLEQEHLAPALKGKIQYFATSYNKCPDHEGRAAVRMFALLDKRVGKRKLIALNSSMECEPAWLYMFYRLRCDAENIVLY